MQDGILRLNGEMEFCTEIFILESAKKAAHRAAFFIVRSELEVGFFTQYTSFSKSRKLIDSAPVVHSLHSPAAHAVRSGLQVQFESLR